MGYIFVDFDGSKYWIELGQDGYALRQVTITEKHVVQISCIHPCLEDHTVDIKNDCEVITKKVFENVRTNATK